MPAPMSDRRALDREDVAALAAVVLGCTVVLTHVDEPWLMVAGFALGLGGVIDVLRRPAGSPHHAKLPAILLIVAIGCVAARGAIWRLEEWRAGELLALGMPLRAGVGIGRGWVLASRLLRDGAVVGAIAFLTLIAWRRRHVAPAKPAEPPSTSSAA